MTPSPEIPAQGEATPATESESEEPSEAAAGEADEAESSASEETAPGETETSGEESSEEDIPAAEPMGEEAAAGEIGSAKPGSDAASTGRAPGEPRTAGERVEVLDRELDESLSEFDGMILREQEAMEEKRAETASGSGSSVPSSSGGSSGRSGEEDEGFLSGGDPGATGSTEQSRGNAGASQPEGEQELDDPELESRVPPDVGDGSDDDIVARQLREAAIEEEDPELREKLWEEYRQYKKSSKASD